MIDPLSGRLPGRTISGQLLLVSGSILFALLAGAAAVAQVDTFEFDSPEQQQRFRQLSNELRCPQCQNANLTGSTGGIAEDLRREVHRMIVTGMSDKEIKRFMFDRYGDFILYRPRLRAATALLWFGPLIFLLLGAAAVYAILRRARRVRDHDSSLNPAEQMRLEEILQQELT